MPRLPFNEAQLRFGTDHDGRPLVYRPHEILVRVTKDRTDQLFQELEELASEPEVPSILVPIRQLDGGERVVRRRVSENWGVVKLQLEVDPKTAVEQLRSLGYQAQLNHVYFSGALESSAQANPNYAAPNYAAPNYAAPNYAAPNYAAPNYAAGLHGGCECGCDAPLTDPDVIPLVPEITAKRSRRGPSAGLAADAHPDLQIHVLDVRPQVGPPERDQTATKDWIETTRGNGGNGDILQTLIDNPGAVLPEALFLNDEFKSGTDDYDEKKTDYAIEPSSFGQGADVNEDRYLDPVTNHAVFIEGIINRTISPAPDKTYVIHHSVMGTLGVVDDAALARAMGHVAHKHAPVSAAGSETSKSIRIMNLSLSGYIDENKAVDCLAETVDNLQKAGWLIVASAGNNASCRPARPAALPGVVSVAAYGPDGPAWFSNYGSWVDACGPGVDIVSEFPNIAAEDLQIREGVDTSEFNTGFARWSGTSFAAPYVAAIIARWIIKNPPLTAASVAYTAALRELITQQSLVRINGYGTVVSDEIVRVITEDV